MLIPPTGRHIIAADYLCQGYVNLIMVLTHRSIGNTIAPLKINLILRIVFGVHLLEYKA